MGYVGTGATRSIGIADPKGGSAVPERPVWLTMGRVLWRMDG